MTSIETNGTALARIPARNETALARAEIVEPMPWPEMVKMGDALVKTRMMPEHVKDGASAALIMLTGRELGMQPMRALRSLQVVKGKVIESADSQLSRFKADGGRAEFKQLDDTKAVLWLKHPNGDEHTETWTIADRKAAGLGQMHDKFPKAMNRSRVITSGLKSLGWEGGVGAYDPEEARAFTSSTTVVADDGPAPVAAAAKPYRADAARKARLSTLLDAIQVTEDRQGYLLEAAGGSFPESDDDLDALISELEARAAEHERRKSVEREPGQD